ncbi:MAG: cobalamin synthesis protein P47K [Prevotellaceae bacterium]|jgi:G3E family GTPase|nr:cobalamin synthesis protein P47K [Prevotellaceae bacterium]
MEKTKLIFVGGFLGAGKTTLLWKAAQQAMKQGLRVGLITNDQAPELVDSALLSQEGLRVAEVSGSCFCCNFNGFTDAAQQIRHETSADVIIAEPVGSCTDLSATILQPLKKIWNRDYEIAPLTVVADPERLTDILDGGRAELHSDAAYIYRKQLEESDLILITKTDCYPSMQVDELKQRTAEVFPFATVMAASALSGEGVGEWFGEVFNRSDAGKRLVSVDYDIYAHGEAVLGWLNGTVRLNGLKMDWYEWVGDYLHNLSECFDSNNYPVGHVKVIAERDKQYIAGNLTGKLSTLSMRGAIEPCDAVQLTINARVETSPETLDKIVNDTLSNSIKNRCKAKTVAWKYLTPGRPNPTHRFTEVV